MEFVCDLRIVIWNFTSKAVMTIINSLPSVVIVGRGNVGKSTLFNKIAEENKALVLAESGTTRDRLEAQITWQRKTFTLVDTGGLDPKKTDDYYEPIIKQSLAAQERAAVIVLVADVTVGLIPADRGIARALRQSGKKVILAVNKCDNQKRRAEAALFHRLNLPLYPVSAKNGVGTGDLLDAITQLLPQVPAIAMKPDMTLALIGKPNVGKSALLNSLYGEERMIVSPLPHTTRDSQDVLVLHNERLFKVIDTAGIRRGSHQGDLVEELSIAKSRQALERSDVVGLVIDISQDITSQDKRLSDEITASGKGIFIIANKWDLIPEKDSATIGRFQKYLAISFPHLSWAPIVFTSATIGTRIKNILALAWAIYQNFNKQTSEEDLAIFLKKIAVKRKPTIGKGTRRPKLLALEQEAARPPRFALTIPNKTNLAENYKRFMINMLRDEFDLEGVPVKLTVKEKVY